MKRIQVEGWISVDKLGRVPKEQRKPHPTLRSGFPYVYSAPSAIYAPCKAHKVLVTVEDYQEATK